MSDIAQLATGHWLALLPMLGVPTSALCNKQGPCPICGGKDRFRFDNLDGRGTWFCNVCGPGDGFKLVAGVNGWGFREVAQAVKDYVQDKPRVSVISAPKMPVDKRAMAKIWESGGPIEGNARAYFEGRGLFGPYPPALRFASSVILAGVTAPDGKRATIHRTYLDGAVKVDRKLMAGTFAKGSAIRLGVATDTLAIAEGIETALAVTRDTGLPCWSTISADGMIGFEPPKGVTTLHIFGDNDLKFAGQAAAYRLAHRVTTQRDPIAAVVHIPDVAGTDFADRTP